jgi:hypothetical protein
LDSGKTLWDRRFPANKTFAKIMNVVKSTVCGKSKIRGEEPEQTKALERGLSATAASIILRQD